MKRIFIGAGFCIGILTLSIAIALHTAQASPPDEALVVQTADSMGNAPTVETLFASEHQFLMLPSGVPGYFVAADNAWVYVAAWAAPDVLLRLSPPNNQHEPVTRFSPQTRSTFAWTPDQRWLLYVELVGDDRILMRVRPDGSEQQNLTEGLASVLGAFLVSPDSQWAYVATRDVNQNISTLYRISLTSGEQHVLLESAASGISLSSISPDGNHLILIKGLSIYLMNADGGDPLPIGTGDVGRVEVGWLASKNLMVIGAFSSPGSRVFLADVATGRTFRDVYDAGLVAVSPDDEWLLINQSGLSLDRMRWNSRDADLIDVSVLGYLGWTPDGSTYFYYDARHIRGVQPDGPAVDVLAFPANTVYGGGWFVHDDWAYFTLSGATGANLYRMRFDGSDFQQITDFEGRRVVIVEIVTPTFDEWRSGWLIGLTGGLMVVGGVGLSARARQGVK